MKVAPVACARASANAVLPTPGSPSRNSGRFSFRARYPAVARPSSARYPVSATALASASGDAYAAGTGGTVMTKLCPAAAVQHQHANANGPGALAPGPFEQVGLAAAGGVDGGTVGRHAGDQVGGRSGAGVDRALQLFDVAAELLQRRLDVGLLGLRLVGLDLVDDLLEVGLDGRRVGLGAHLLPVAGLALHRDAARVDAARDVVLDVVTDRREERDAAGDPQHRQDRADPGHRLAGTGLRLDDGDDADHQADDAGGQNAQDQGRDRQTVGRLRGRSGVAGRGAVGRSTVGLLGRRAVGLLRRSAVRLLLRDLTWLRRSLLRPGALRLIGHWTSPRD